MSPTPKLAALVIAAAPALLAGVVVGRPELVAVGAALTAAALRSRPSPPPRIDAVRVEVTPARVLEGDTITVRLGIEASHAARATVALTVPEDRVARSEPVGVTCAAGASATLAIRARRWGRAELGPLVVRAVDDAGLRAARAVVEQEGAVRVLYPVIQPP